MGGVPLYAVDVTTATQELFEKALRFRLKQRARLLSELLVSLDGEADSDANAAWAREIERCCSPGSCWQIDGN